MTVNVADAPVRPGLCQVAEKRVPCLEPGVSTWDAACVHEHVTTEISVCAGHEWRMTGRPWNCMVCANSDQPHDCPVKVTRRQP